MKPITLVLLLMNFGYVLGQNSANISTTVNILPPRIDVNEDNQIAINETENSIELNSSEVEIHINKEDSGRYSQDTDLLTFRAHNPANAFTITYSSHFTMRMNSKVILFEGITGEWHPSLSNYELFKIKFDKIKVEETLGTLTENPLVVTLHYH